MKEFEFDFEKLNVYQKSLDLIHNIFQIHKEIPREFQYSVGSNLIRAAMSIANNIAEGSGKKSKKEKERFYRISLDSARECISVFNIMNRENLISNKDYTELRLGSKQITAMLSGLISSLN